MSRAPLIISGFLPLPFLLSALPAVAETPDISVGVYRNAGTQEIQFKDQIRRFDLNTHSLQMFVATENWSLAGTVHNADESDSWQTAREENALGYKQSGFDVAVSYYLDEWSFTLAYGQNESQLDQTEYLARPNLQQNIISEQSTNKFSSDDAFIQVSVSRWLDLSSWNENLAGTFELSAGYFDNTSSVGRTISVHQNRNDAQAEQFISRYEQQRGNDLQFGDALLPSFNASNEQWQVGVGVSLDYLLALWGKDWVVSAWANADWLTDNDNSLTLIANGRGPNAVRRTISLDESIEDSQQQSTSWGLDISVPVTQAITLSAGVSDSNSGNAQTQLSLFYQF